MTGANNLFNGDIGYKPYTGETLAGGPVSGVDMSAEGQFGINNYLWGGLNLEQQIANANLYGGPGIQDARQMGDYLIRTNGLDDNMRSTAGKYGSIYDDATGQENPYLLATIAANDRRISDRVNSAVSGAGRYGSGAHTDVLARSLAEAADPILAQDYTQRQQTRLGATSGLKALYGDAANLAGNWAKIMPALNEAQYGSAERLQNVGKYYQDRGQQQLANDMALYNANEARPWEQLQRFQAAISGAGATGGTKVTATTPYTPTTLQRIGGGAATGAGIGSIFGAPGAGVGALAGGLMGLL